MILSSGRPRASLLPFFFFAVLAPVLPAQTTKPVSLPSLAAPTTEELRRDRVWQKANSQYDSARAALLSQVDEEAHNGPFRPEWDSLSKYQTPQWYRDAKFGIFIHWGVYSVPAYANEWYPRNMYQPGSDENKHQVATHGPLTQFGYKDFIPMFKAENFDAADWAALFKESGARYVVPVFEHHDGFAMYDSGLSDWTAVHMGPHRDLSGEIATAVRAQGLRLGASSHRIEHDWFMDGVFKLDSDGQNPNYAGLYGPAHSSQDYKDSPGVNPRAYLSPEYASDWLARDAEIVQKYHPDLVYFDWWIGDKDLEPYLQRFAAFYYNDSSRHGQLGVLNYKDNAMHEHSAVLDIERGQLGTVRPEPWQTDTSISNKSWGYIDGDSFKSSESIVQQLVDIVSKNGNLLLNIGPKSDGTIPEEARKVLREIGGWMRVNGDAIYGTTPWDTFGEGPTKVVEGAFHDTDTHAYTAADYRFTRKSDVLYAIELGSPEGKEAIIRSLSRKASAPWNQVSAVTLLGVPEPLRFQQQEDGLHITLPSQPGHSYAFAYRIQFKK
jgi:alpha-L-fucosidase